MGIPTRIISILLQQRANLAAHVFFPPDRDARRLNNYINKHYNIILYTP